MLISNNKFKRNSMYYSLIFVACFALGLINIGEKILEYSHYGVVICSLDALIEMTMIIYSNVFINTIIIIIYISMKLRLYLDNSLMAYGSRFNFLKKLVWDSFVDSLLVSFLQVLSTYAVCILYQMRIYNWNKVNSTYYLFNQEKGTIIYGCVVFVVFLVIFIWNLFIRLIATASYYYFEKKIITTLITLLVWVLASFNFWSVQGKLSYVKWINYNYQSVLIALIWLLVCFVVVFGAFKLKKGKRK